jgi:hypothetical protein
MRAARLAASLAVLLSTAPAWGAGKARPHPDTKGDQDCASCHAQSTPAVVEAWEASPHGVALVKCLVCHGSTGKDFVRSAAPERCRGCHGAEVDSAAPLAKRGVTSCFACHDPHALRASPHGRRAR